MSKCYDAKAELFAALYDAMENGDMTYTEVCDTAAEAVKELARAEERDEDA